MKTSRTLIAVVVLLAAVSAFAQSAGRAIAKANVPFAFTVEDVTLPAGTYTLSMMPPYNLLKVQSEEGGRVATAFAIPTPHTNASEQNKLIFQHVGSHYFLTQVWEQGNVRRDLKYGKLARELAKTGEKAETTSILASVAR